jgi:hypothetical protein
LYILYLFSIRKFSVPRTTILLHITRAKRPRKILTVRSITQVLIKVLASCTTCLFMKIFQRTLSQCPDPCFWAKADAKVHTFPRLTKFYGNYFSKTMKVFQIIYKSNCLHLIYNIKA